MYNIRQATYEDIEDLIQYRIELLTEVGDKELESSQNELVRSLDTYFRENLGKKFFSWIAVNDNGILAVSGLSIFEKPPAFSNLSGLEGYIMNMYVKKEYRGKGIATNIMKTIIEYLKNIGISEVTLKATYEGKPIYERLGFEEYTNGMILRLDR